MLRHVKVRLEDANDCAQTQELKNQADGFNLENVTNCPDVKYYKTEMENDSSTSTNDCAINPSNDHSCEICGQALKSKNRKLRHMKLHTDVENAMCKICAMTFKWKSRLLLHMKSHSEERNHKCEICATCFKRRTDMQRHIRTQHKERKRERQHKCELCPKIFTSRHSMLQHMKLHLRGEMFRCKICLKDFVQRDELQSHVASMHQDDSNNSQEVYECHVCPANFERKQLMSEHVESHSVVSYRRKSKRKLHVEENVYTCNLCSKSFKARRYLVQHMNSHNEGQQFKCQICNNNFKTKQCLVTHSKLHMRGKMFRCNFCAKDFIQKIGLQNHLSKMHRNTNDPSTDKCVDEEYNMVFIKEENHDINSIHDEIINNAPINEDRVGPLLVEVKSEPTEILLESKSPKFVADVKEELDKSYGWNYF